MNPLSLYLEFLLKLSFCFEPFSGVSFGSGINLMQSGCKIRQHESIRIFGTHKISPLFRQIGLVSFLIDGKEKLLFLSEEFRLLLIAMELKLRLIHQSKILRV